MATMDTLTTRIESTCATNTWAGISELLKAFNNDFQRLTTTVLETIITITSWIYRNIICPLSASGINILGFLIDKILLGSPSLRQYFHHGLFQNDIYARWRQWVKDNSGWDIYETMGKIPSDLFGILGGGVGIFTILNHTLTSFCYLTYNYCDIIVATLDGKVTQKQDQRHLAVKIIFGIIAAPLVIPLIIESNIIACLLSGIGHTIKSIHENLRVVSNLLGHFGRFGERSKYQDNRSLTARIFFGVISAPIVLGLALVSNTVDAVWTIERHILKSVGWNLRASFNVLGPYGSFGRHRGLGDKRPLAAKIIFGILSAPFVLPFVVFTNLLDFSITAFKHFFLSFKNNLRVIFNVLGRHGLFTYHRRYHDDRHLAPIIVFGIISAPIVLATAIVTNVLDAALTCFLQTMISAIGLIASTYNIVLGKNGVFGERTFYFANDSRHLATKIIFGILSLPIVVPVALFTNILDLACTFSNDFFTSFKNNLHASYNLLGKAGIFGKQWAFEDTRPLYKKIIYGVFSFPFVFSTALVTNLFDISCTFIKNCALSYHYNLISSFNYVLGSWGMFGPRHDCKDPRNEFTKYFFGWVTAPQVAMAAIFFNLIDIQLTMAYHSSISFFKNVRSTFNILLGRDGVFGEKRSSNDNRNLITKIAYGVLTFLPTALVSLVTNFIDLACTAFSHLFLSFGRNLRPTFNILLGSYGLFGHRRRFVDSRGLFTKILFGIATAPLVLLTAIATNVIDLVGTFFKNWKKISTPVLVVAGVVTIAAIGIPIFALRKFAKGLSNIFIRPFVDIAKDRPFQPLRILKGVANTVTLGAFSAVKKVFERATGYNSRFGMPNNRVSEYEESQRKFRTAIELATKSKFPGINDDYVSARPIMRTLFHMRHRIETVLKNIHDIFQEYVREVRKNDPQINESAYNMMTFFSSDRYNEKRTEIQKKATDEERQLWEKAETYLFSV